jgi:hypothetical protein
MLKSEMRKGEAQRIHAARHAFCSFPHWQILSAPNFCSGNALRNPEAFAVFGACVAASRHTRPDALNDPGIFSTAHGSSQEEVGKEPKRTRPLHLHVSPSFAQWVHSMAQADILSTSVQPERQATIKALLRRY